VEAIGLEDVEQSVKIRAKGKATGFARREGDALSIPASVAPRLVAELAPSSKRTLDVVLGALTAREEEWVIKLPAGAKVRSLPSPQKLDTPFGAFNVSFEQAPGKVTLRTSLSFRKSRIAPAEYDAFRSFCEAVDRAFGQRIVVDK
jgi:cellulose synthase operon protein C